ncbi:MAG TPA: Gfo/Idh/MocA family oxidoreductase [Candidatus Deferrimicrobium sp.]|nr:Gfo/Idh/MocA family oxidoreductase [Candidatus Deferrimicrobium sp.]
MNKLKTAVVGVGHLGRHHVKWLSQIAGSELTGLYDIDRTKAIKYAQEYGVTAFESLEQLSGQAQAVSVVVPTICHFEVASYLISQGVHCLIEKPVAVSLHEASRLQELTEEKGVKVTVGHIERFNPAVQALRGLSVSPAFIEAHRLAAFDLRGTDVAVVLDLMIHDIDLTLMFVRSPVVDIQAAAVAVVSEQADIANARLTFANGAVANLTASRISLREMRKMRLFQKSGYYSLDLAARQADLYRLSGADDSAAGMRIPLGNSGRHIVYEKRGDPTEDMLKAELTSFLNSIMDDQPVAVSLEEATAALDVALKVDRIGQQSLARVTRTDPS